MTASTVSRDTDKQVGDPIPPCYGGPLATAVTLQKGCMAALDASGNLVSVTALNTLRVVGRAKMKYVQSATVPNGEVEQGAFEWANSADGDAITAADIGSDCYAVDNATVSKTDGGGVRPFAGKVVAVATTGVMVLQGLFLTASGGGIVGGGTGSVGIPLHTIREMTSGGDVSDIAGNGGILASNTTPIMRGDANGSQEIAWAAGNADPVGGEIPLPADFDGSQDCFLDLYVYTDNAGGGGIDAASFTIATTWDGAAAVADTATDGTPAVTRHVVTATIAAADIPDTPVSVSYLLTPAAHAADPTQLVAAKLRYARRQI